MYFQRWNYNKQYSSRFLFFLHLRSTPKPPFLVFKLYPEHLCTTIDISLNTGSSAHGGQYFHQTFELPCIIHLCVPYRHGRVPHPPCSSIALAEVASAE